jgi:ABC-type phosphate transport system permease subunit
MIKTLIKYIVKGLIYPIPLAIIGVAFSFMMGWKLLKGAYIFVLGAGVLIMLISAILLIGTPKMRREYFDRSEEEKMKDPLRGAEGVGPAIMGIVMMIIGLLLEAFMH